METTKEGTLEQVRLTSRPSASRTIRLPSGQMTWSTEDRTRSQVSSGVRREFCRVTPPLPGSDWDVPGLPGQLRGPQRVLSGHGTPPRVRLGRTGTPRSAPGSAESSVGSHHPPQVRLGRTGTPRSAPGSAESSVGSHHHCPGQTGTYRDSQVSSGVRREFCRVTPPLPGSDWDVPGLPGQLRGPQRVLSGHTPPRVRLGRTGTPRSAPGSAESSVG